ncbi:hypothetical protein K1719_045168 [Acacia pycnantha]|nr:hypothetical protein K1719_045168 [Acacia pycnantha]
MESLGEVIFKRDRIAIDYARNVVIADILASGEEFECPSLTRLDEDDVYRPQMNLDEGSGDSEEELFGTSTGVSVQMPSDLEGMNLTSNTQPSAPSGSTSIGKRKRGEGVDVVALSVAKEACSFEDGVPTTLVMRCGGQRSKNVLAELANNSFRGREKCPHKCPESVAQDVVLPPPQQLPNRLSVNTPATTSDESFGPWMLVNRRNRGRPLQRNDSRQLLSSGTGVRTVNTTTIGQQSRFAALGDLANLDQVNHSARQTVHRSEQTEFRKDRLPTMKPINSGRKEEPAGNLRSKGMDLNAKSKGHYRVKQASSGPIPATRPSSSVEGIHVAHSIGPHERDEAFNLLKTNSNDSGPSVALNQSKSPKVLVQSTEDRITTNNEMVLHVGHKKSSGRQSRGQRTHNVVHGNLVNLGHQKNEVIEQSHADPSLEQTQIMPQRTSPRSSDHWDPNEDVAPDFMEANVSFVAETQFEQQNEGGSRRPRLHIAALDSVQILDSSIVLALLSVSLIFIIYPPEMEKGQQLLVKA